jgi:hypothetical protein
MRSHWGRPLWRWGAHPAPKRGCDIGPVPCERPGFWRSSGWPLGWRGHCREKTGARCRGGASGGGARYGVAFCPAMAGRLLPGSVNLTITAVARGGMTGSAASEIVAPVIDGLRTKARYRRTVIGGWM